MLLTTVSSCQPPEVSLHQFRLTYRGRASQLDWNSAVRPIWLCSLSCLCLLSTGILGDSWIYLLQKPQRCLPEPFLLFSYIHTTFHTFILSGAWKYMFSLLFRSWGLNPGPYTHVSPLTMNYILCFYEIFIYLNKLVWGRVFHSSGWPPTLYSWGWSSWLHLPSAARHVPPH